MRRVVKLLAVAAWLGVHALLWLSLPPVPRWTMSDIVFHSFAFTPDGRSLVTCDAAEVVVWDRATGRRERTWPRPGSRPTGGEYKSVLVMSPSERTAIIYDTPGDREQVPYLLALDTGQAEALPTFGTFITGPDPCIGFLPGGRTAYQLCSSTADGGEVKIRLWDLPNGPERRIAIGWRLYRDLEASADGRHAVAYLHAPAPNPSTVLVLDLATAHVMHVLTFDRGVTHASLSPDGRTVAVSTIPANDMCMPCLPDVELWDAASGRRIGAAGMGFGGGWNADGRLLIADRSTWRLVDGRTGSQVSSWAMPTDQGPYMAPIPGGGHFLVQWTAVRRSETITWMIERLPGASQFWHWSTAKYSVHDTQTGMVRGQVPTSSVGSLAWTADGSALAVDDAGTVRVWDIPPGKPGGIVLGLMIAEVTVAIAWTAWHRRKWRPQCAAV